MSIVITGLADYSHYRKTMMMCSIYLFGILALPFAGLTGTSYAHLNALSTLFVLLETVSGIYTVIEASYIPIFMRSFVTGNGVEDGVRRRWKRGSTVSVLGLLSGNLGAILSLLIGVVITYSRGSYVTEGYFK